jgi:hypothetical protein
MDKPTYQFGTASHAYREKLTPEKRAVFEQSQKDTEAAVKTLDQDHAETREEKIAAREEFLTQHYEAQFNMPRPPGTPPPPLKQASAIKAEARQDVDQAHIHARQEILLAQKTHEREFLAKELGFDPPTPKAPDLGHDI